MEKWLIKKLKENRVSKIIYNNDTYLVRSSEKSSYSDEYMIIHTYLLNLTTNHISNVVLHSDSIVKDSNLRVYTEVEL